MKSIFQFSILAVMVVLMISFNADARGTNSGNRKILKTLKNMQTKLDILVSDQTCSVVENKLDQHIADTNTKLEEILQAIGNGGNGDNCQILSEDARWAVLDCGFRDQVFDKDSGVTWEQHPISLEMAWQEAVDYCPTLGDGWVLPEVEILETLVDSSNFAPTLPTGHPFDNVHSSHYWSSTINTSFIDSAWMVDFNTGAVSSSSMALGRHVWCVRR